MFLFWESLTQTSFYFFFCLFVLLQFTANCTVFVKGDQISQGQSMELLQNLDIFLLIFFFFQFM